MKTFQSARLFLPRSTLGALTKNIKDISKFEYKVEKPKLWDKFFNKLKMIIWGGKNFLMKIDEDLYFKVSLM